MRSIENYIFQAIKFLQTDENCFECSFEFNYLLNYIFKLEHIMFSIQPINDFLTESYWQKYCLVNKYFFNYQRYNYFKNSLK